MRELEPGDRRRRSFEGLKALHRPALHLDGVMILVSCLSILDELDESSSVV